VGKRITIQEVDQRFASANLERVGSFTHVLTKVLGICLKCGQYVAPKPAYITHGKGGCRDCGFAAMARSHELSIDEIDRRLKAMNAERVGSYVNVTTGILCICLKCNKYISATVNNFKTQSGACNPCGIAKTAAATKTPIEKVDKICGKQKVKRLGEYISRHKPMKVACLKCNWEFFPTLGSLDLGHGCPRCAEYGIDLSKPTVFYIVANPTWIKCGITNSSAQRVAKHSKQGLDRVHAEITFQTGYEALAVEKKWISHIKTLPSNMRATKADITDGHTETVKNTQAIQTWIFENILV
jgi:hypothetical protein